jgi:O-antigen/teichoic acid export membrane protein
MAAAPEPAGMRSRILRGLAWKVFSQAFRQLSRIVVAIVLARLLTPHDFGLAAMVLVFSSLVIIFSDLSLGAALVQRPELTELDRSTVFWVSTGVGVLFTVAGIAVSGPVAAFYGEPEVQPLFIGLSLSFVLTALGTTQTALLNRDMDFRALEVRLMAGSVAGAVVGLALAAGGFGAWALIAQQIATALASTALLWAFSPWKPSMRFSMASLRDLSSFSLNVFGTRIVFYFNRNADNLLVGRFLGPSALGAYTVAYNLMLAPIGRIAMPLVEVLFPAFSRMQDDKARIGALWLRAVRVVGTITIPGMIGLALVAPEFVHVTLGDKWDAAVPVIQILAWVGLMQSLQGMNSSILQACDRTGLLLRCAIVTVVASVIAFAVGVQWGIVGVAAGYCIASSFAEPYYAWQTMRTIGVPVRAYLASLAGIAGAALAMGACVLATRELLLPEGLPDGLRLAILIAVGAASYLPLWAWRAPEIVADVRGVLRRRRGTAQPVPA